MNYTDLYSSSPELALKELALGFKHSFCAQVASIDSAKKASAFRSLPSHRPVMVAESPDSQLLASALNSPNPDRVTLVTPFSQRGFFREDVLFATVGAQAAKHAPVAFHLPLNSLLHQEFVYRARFLRQARLFVKKAAKFKAPFVLTGGAANELELKSPQEHLAVATTLYGMALPQAQYALTVLPSRLLEAAGIQITDDTEIV